MQPKIALLADLLRTEIEPLEHVGDVRQCGFMVGIELVQDRTLRSPYPPELRMGARVTQYIRESGIILRPLGDVVVLMPPLSITEDEIRLLVRSTGQAIARICSEV